MLLSKVNKVLDRAMNHDFPKEKCQPVLSQRYKIQLAKDLKVLFFHPNLASKLDFGGELVIDEYLLTLQTHGIITRHSR